jgi:hypothetical protein
MSIERIKELETAIEKAIEWLGANSMPAATGARQVLRAALATPPAAPATCPVCPVCGDRLFRIDNNNEFVWWCAVCKWTQPDAEQRPKRPEPVPVMPVVRYYRHPQSADFCKTVNGVISETVGCWEGAIGEVLKCHLCLETPVSEVEYLAAKRAEYAAKSPAAAKVIEPLGNYPDMKQMRDKMNEVVAWINAKGAV